MLLQYLFFSICLSQSTSKSMSKLFRALVISTIATGTAIVIVNAIQRREKQSKDNAVGQSRFVDAEQLSEEERALLSSELDAML